MKCTQCILFTVHGRVYKSFRFFSSLKQRHSFTMEINYLKFSHMSWTHSPILPFKLDFDVLFCCCVVRSLNDSNSLLSLSPYDSITIISFATSNHVYIRLRHFFRAIRNLSEHTVFPNFIELPQRSLVGYLLSMFLTQNNPLEVLFQKSRVIWWISNGPEKGAGSSVNVYKSLCVAQCT